MKKFIYFIVGLVMFPAINYAQVNYRGDKNAKGLPEGKGVLSIRTWDRAEFLEGTFKAGVPVEGKCFVIDHKNFDSRRILTFEGTFKPKVKGTIEKLDDLLMYGKMTLYCYEDDEDYDEYGYHVKMGTYNGETFDGKPTIFGVKGQTSNNLSPELKKIYDYLLPKYAYYLMKEEEDKPCLYLNRNKDKTIFLVSVHNNDELLTVDDFCNTNGTDGLVDGLAYGLAYKDDNKDCPYYFKGYFEKGKLKKIRTLKQYSMDDGVTDLYLDSKEQIDSPFSSEEEFDNYLVIDDEHYFHKWRTIRPGYRVGSSNIETLDQILSNPQKRNNKDIIERAKVICAYRLTNPDMSRDWQIYMVLKKYPEIANANDVIATWYGKKVNIKDAFLALLRKDPGNLLRFYNYVYNDWGSMTEDEIYDTEHLFILATHPKYLNNTYKEYFPNGQYVGKDFYEGAWADAYINNCKRILTKDDPRVWMDSFGEKVSYPYGDWLHYPMLSKGIGEYSENSRLSRLFGELQGLPKDFLFNQNKLAFLQALFKKTKYIYINYAESFNSDVFDDLKEGRLNDEAKIYRALMDGIGAAAQVNELNCAHTGRTDLVQNFNYWYAGHAVLETLIDGIQAARTISSSTPEMRPTCKKAEERIMSKIKMLYDQVYIHDDAWREAMEKQKRENLANKEAYDKTLQDVENLELPNYKYEDDTWQQEYNDEVSRKICFPGLEDVSCTKIWKAKNGSYYRTVAGAFLSSKYKLEQDAIIAAYAYLKYGVVRQKGRL